MNEGKKQELKDRKRYGVGCEIDEGVLYFFKQSHEGQQY